ncbi:MAG: putative bifunctional diguanylate cyclase/phosphodiesterase [Gammaproteobacteria bacterium]
MFLAGSVQAAQLVPSERSAQSWLDEFREQARTGGAQCTPVELPSLASDVPALAYQVLDARDLHAQGRRVVYSQDTIAEHFMVLSRSATGCVHAALSGRLHPFNARHILSPLANARLPETLTDSPVVVILQDHKTIRPWVRVASEEEFDALNNRLWVGLGAYSGVLMVLLLVGIGVSSWNRSRLALAYVVYVFTLMVWQLQAFGTGIAWLPFWPSHGAFPVMQALSVAGVVGGIGIAVVAFLRPRRHLRRFIVGGVVLSMAFFVSSIWTFNGYRAGAFILAPLALAVMGLLVARLRDSETSSIRWFAAGLVATMVGGTVQASAVIGNGAGMSGLAAAAFPLGNLIESALWLAALAARLREDRASLEAQLRHDASHDALTGLGNRARLQARLDQTLADLHDGREHPPVGLLFIDLDRFKLINDSLGHATGDRVLVQTANELRALGLPAQLIARFGGDEFVILMNADLHWSQVLGAATSVARRFEEGMDLAGNHVQVSVSVGVVPITAHYRDMDEVIRDADLAMHAAKRAGGGRDMEFKAQLREEGHALTHAINELQGALANDRLELVFEPVIGFDRMEAVGFEVAVRWDRANQAALKSAEIMPLAERTGLAGEIGAWMLRKTVTQIAQWQQQGRWQTGRFVVVRAFGQQLVDDRLIKELEELLFRYPVDPSCLRLSFTEPDLMRNRSMARRALPTVQGMGLMVCLDGFGEGVSSLGMISELGFDVVNLAPSVTEGLAHHGRSQNLARAAVTLGIELGCITVAKGVDTDAQSATAKAMGFACGQGAELGGTVESSALDEWLNAWRESQVTSAVGGEGRQLH